MQLPRLKKEIRAFLANEEGKVDVKGIVTVGAILAASQVAAEYSHSYSPDCSSAGGPRGGHLNNIEVTQANGFTATHSHCLETHSESHSQHSEGHSKGMF